MFRMLHQDSKKVVSVHSIQTYSRMKTSQPPMLQTDRKSTLPMNNRCLIFRNNLRYVYSICITNKFYFDALRLTKHLFHRPNQPVSALLCYDLHLKLKWLPFLKISSFIGLITACAAETLAISNFTRFFVIRKSAYSLQVAHFNVLLVNVNENRNTRLQYNLIVNFVHAAGNVERDHWTSLWHCKLVNFAARPIGRRHNNGRNSADSNACGKHYSPSRKQ